MLQLAKLTPKASQALAASQKNKTVSSAEYYRDCMKDLRALVGKLGLSDIAPRKEPVHRPHGELNSLIDLTGSAKELYKRAKLAGIPSLRFRLYLAAAEKGSLPAMLGTALCYYRGEGTAKEPACARWWLENAIAIYAELYYWSVE